MGNVHDSSHFIDLQSGKESAVYADSAYKSQKYDAWLKDHHVDNKVIERAYGNTSLTPEQKQNRRNSGTRCTVERVFGVLKLRYGMGQAIYLQRSQGIFPIKRYIPDKIATSSNSFFIWRVDILLLKYTPNHDPISAPGVRIVTHSQLTAPLVARLAAPTAFQNTPTITNVC